MKLNLKKKKDNKIILAIFGIVILVMTVMYIFNNAMVSSIEKNADITIFYELKGMPDSDPIEDRYYLINLKNCELYIINWKKFLMIKINTIHNKELTQQEIDTLLDNIQKKKNGTLIEKEYAFSDPRRFYDYIICYKDEQNKNILKQQCRLVELPFNTSY